MDENEWAALAKATGVSTIPEDVKKKIVKSAAEDVGMEVVDKDGFQPRGFYVETRSGQVILNHENGNHILTIDPNGISRHSGARFPGMKEGARDERGHINDITE